MYGTGEHVRGQPRSESERLSEFKRTYLRGASIVRAESGKFFQVCVEC